MQPIATKTQNVKKVSKKSTGWFEWRKLLATPALQFAALVLLLFAAVFGIWRVAFYQSDVEQGLAELRAAYQGMRPLESRTTANFDYASVSNTRGNSIVIADEKAHRRAEIFLLDAAKDSSDAKAHHALGLLNLTDKKYDEALDEFNLALKLAPDNSKIHNDLAASLLEMSKKAALENDDAKKITFLDQSLKHLDKAIELDPKLPEPRFNRALCLQALPSPEQAKQAWREYLTLDSSSQWAEEARRNLQFLESQKTRESSALELERDFLIAVRQKNDDEAWRLLSRNRELIRGKYLPQRLAISFLTAKGSEKDSILQALQYAGELEFKRIGDPFAREIAGYYSTLAEDKAKMLKQAQKKVQKGYELCLDFKFLAALDEFRTARDLFVQAGDVWEANLSEYSIGYSLINTNQTAESLIKFDQVVKFSQSRKFKWLETTSLHWSANGLRNLKHRTRSKKHYEKALAVAEEIKDSYAMQRNLLELAKYHSFVGQHQMALRRLQLVFEESNLPETSRRQKYRNYDDGLRIIIGAKLYSAAKPIALETVWLADELGDRMFEVLSRNNAGLAFVQTGNFDTARTWLNEGKKKAETITDESSRKKMIAYSNLKFGYLEKESGDYEKSEQFYDEAARQYEKIEIPSNLYEAQKGKLLAYQALGKSAELEQQIPLTLKLTEDYREKILEEQERTSFFDSEESIFDIAVKFEYEAGRYEQAYNYAEKSSSRSLLDWLHKGAEVSRNSKNIEILLKEKASPRAIPEIRAQMPDGVQILQYSVLNSRVLIWLVSKENFAVIPVEISAAELRGKVENYIELMKQGSRADQTVIKQLSQELYGLLILPILDQINPNQVICLIPSKVLFHLPFAALISRDEKPLLADFNLIYAPSANVFLFCTENAQEKSLSPNETLLSFGNPAFDHRVFDFPDLPTAEREAREITAFYDDAQTFPGREATKKAWLESVKDAEIIHFAGHYVVVPNSPLSSFLLLARNGDEPESSILTNSELVGENLVRAKIIVLSACQTGVEDYSNGEGLIGLSRTFLAAGVPLIVASQWSVDSEATMELMKRFHFYRRQEKMTTASALRSAQLEMFGDSTGRFREPYYWAAFAAYGGYAAF
jgi:CHAT domain-containing protein